MTSEELYMRRRRLNLSQKELGELFGVTSSTIYKWEHGKAFPPPPMLNKALTFVELEATIGSKVITQVDTPLPDKESLPRRISHTRRILKDDEEKIRAAVAAHPDVSCAELCELVEAAGGARVPTYTMSRELRRLNLKECRKWNQRCLENDEERIRAAAAAHPDVSCAELCELVEAAGGARVSPTTMYRELKRLNLLCKDLKDKEN